MTSGVSLCDVGGINTATGRMQRRRRCSYGRLIRNEFEPLTTYYHTTASSSQSSRVHIVIRFFLDDKAMTFTCAQSLLHIVVEIDFRQS